MDDTVATSDAPASSTRVVVPVLVDGEIRLYYETDYQFPRNGNEDLEYYWRTRRELSRVYHARDCKRARADDDAIRPCLREARAGDAGMPEDCAVCLQDFDAKATLRVMPCSHAFHPDCIFTWLRVKAVCPLCRQDLPPPRLDDSNDEDDTDSDEDDSDSDDEDGTNYDAQQESTPAVPDRQEARSLRQLDLPRVCLCVQLLLP